MPLSTSDSLVFAVQIALVFAIGYQFRGRLHTGEDFTLGRRRVGLPFSAATIAMNSVPLWWLFALAGMAFSLGVAAIWFALALLGGNLIGGWYLAPRLRALTNLQQRGTFAELLVRDAGDRLRGLLLRSILLIVVAVIMFATIAQLQLAAQVLATVFALPAHTVIASIGAVLGIALFLSGIWTSAAIDVWQIVVLFFVLSVAAIALVVGIAFAPALQVAAVPKDWFADHHGLLTLSFTLGIAFVAGDVVGQAPLLSRYMACSSDAELARARIYSLVWSVIALTLALLVGFGVRSLNEAQTPSYSAFIYALSSVLAPQVVSILVLATVGAATAAIGGCWQTLASHLANDLKRGGTPLSLARCRVALVAAIIVTVVLAINLPLESAGTNFDRLLFCWHALGAAFGPLLIVRLSGKRVRPGSSLGSMWSGLLLTIVFYLMPDTPGELLERGLPFAAALGIALSGGERRRNPDRADRGERTVHDRLPI